MPELQTPEELRELAIDTMASWALEGMQPNPAITHDNSEFVNGSMTAEQIIAKAKSGAYSD